MLRKGRGGWSRDGAPGGLLYLHRMKAPAGGGDTPLEEALPAWWWGWDRVGTQTVRPRTLEQSHTQTSEGGSERGHVDSEMLTWKHTWED